jgi:hypothetical protein
MKDPDNKTGGFIINYCTNERASLGYDQRLRKREKPVDTMKIWQYHFLQLMMTILMKVR